VSRGPRSTVTVLLAAGALVTPLITSMPAFAGSQPSGDFLVNVHPLAHQAPAGLSIRPMSTPQDCLKATQGEFACQTPSDIAKAYDIPSTVNGQPAGTGQTIVIIDAYGSPTAASDLSTFSKTFGLPQAVLTTYYPTGKPTFQGTAAQLNWAQETSLDLQWAHAVAPAAHLALVVAPTSYGSALNSAEQYAVTQHLGNVMSMSFGEPESLIHGNSTQQSQAHTIYQQARDNGMTVFASSGDSGSDNNAGSANFGFPASDPLVTAVGGTNLWSGTTLEATQGRETVWGDFASCPTTCADGPIGATGGAPSLYTGKPGSDVSYNASVYTGVLTYLGFLGGANNGFYFFGGTSASSPQWAAATALMDQAAPAPLGYVRDRLAGWASTGLLHDVTAGANSTPTYTGGFSAAPGYDAPTGYGTPDVGQLIASVASH
jgi:subtilase family serine protease